MSFFCDFCCRESTLTKENVWSLLWNVSVWTGLLHIWLLQWQRTIRLLRFFLVPPFVQNVRNVPVQFHMHQRFIVLLLSLPKKALQIYAHLHSSLQVQLLRGTQTNLICFRTLKLISRWAFDKHIFQNYEYGYIQQVCVVRNFVAWDTIQIQYYVILLNIFHSIFYGNILVKHLLWASKVKILLVQSQVVFYTFCTYFSPGCVYFLHCCQTSSNLKVIPMKMFDGIFVLFILR